MIATGRARVGRCPTIRACAIDPYCERGAGRCFFFLPLACARERSAGRRFGNKLTPRERRRVLLRSSTHASRRSTAAIFYAITVLFDRTGGLHRSVPGSIGAALHPIMSSHQRRAPQRDRTVTAPPGTSLRSSSQE